MENILLTGFRDLDYLLKGSRESELIFIGGRPCTGKSTLALNIAQNVTEHQNIPTLFFSLEASKEQLLARAKEMGWENQNGFIVDDEPEISIDDLIIKSRAHKKADKIGLIIIDYLQLLRYEGFETAQLRTSSITQKLKRLAMELSIPIIVFSQHPKVLRNRDDHRPILQDLRYIGAIEQDLDRVIFLYRDEFYNETTEHKGITEIIVAKNYRGSVGIIELAFNPEMCKFTSLNEEVIKFETTGIQSEKNILNSFLTQGYDLMEERLINTSECRTRNYVFRKEENGIMKTTSAVIEFCIKK